MLIVVVENQSLCLMHTKGAGGGGVAGKQCEIFPDCDSNNFNGLSIR